MQREIDKKKGKVDDETKKRIAEQGELRQRMRAALAQVEAVLAMLGRLSEEEEERMQPLLVGLLPALQPLLLSQLLKLSASQLHRSLLRTLPSHLRSLSLPLALSVQLAITRGQRVWDDRLHSAMPERRTGGCGESSEGRSSDESKRLALRQPTHSLRTSGIA